ncbi:hypothetical protein RFI_11305 [Reticulomyxa filosa]|uniref:Dynein regulatory complex subunit 7 C-terminal domain-containing protein n=1 Tax=Reticulomyxa filosa TaxID=46433 RepID=X6NIN2_RETFI|nr:hypothetical protein RFI_11305 [Reticulomyxa filosa]|eukprot:ETO25836.1 hypothetical protein RFI_11305 [Reticulomyxa filosa]
MYEEGECVKLIKDPLFISKEESVHDTLKEKPDGEDKRETTETYDSLSAYLPQTKVSSREQMNQVKEECLRALKDRMTERLNVIMRRLNKETEELEKKKIAFARAQANAPEKVEIESEFEEYRRKAEFRIRITKQRLLEHEQDAVLQMNELNERIEKLFWLQN